MHFLFWWTKTWHRIAFWEFFSSILEYFSCGSLQKICIAFFIYSPIACYAYDEATRPIFIFWSTGWMRLIFQVLFSVGKIYRLCFLCFSSRFYYFLIKDICELIFAGISPKAAKKLIAFSDFCILECAFQILIEIFSIVRASNPIIKFFINLSIKNNQSKEFENREPSLYPWWN